MFKRILVPTDGSRGVEKAVNCATTIALAFDSKIYLLFVTEPPALLFEYANVAEQSILEAINKEGKHILEKTAQQIREAGVEQVETVLRAGTPAKVILDFVDEAKIDLIVMGTHGRRGLDRILLGSVTEEVVRLSKVPVMTVRMGQ
ncbi:MAG: universal stress protein [Candidatus Bipolaricaulota bacterium]|nr:universal stress protein [Candidatus Bipolaricaulota bacterium]MCS7275184.1 universal stress protein [Candidatus Bipolaricaulota bacterium]MDW8110447.1 universal stress protein [Candidatus Bipolaricaulota bacterium]MDW8329677.1 universal stress protein [Candidatus Bipolaricaulota bacterium]